MAAVKLTVAIAGRDWSLNAGDVIDVPRPSIVQAFAKPTDEEVTVHAHPFKPADDEQAEAEDDEPAAVDVVDVEADEADDGEDG